MIVSTVAVVMGNEAATSRQKVQVDPSKRRIIRGFQRKLTRRPVELRKRTRLQWLHLRALIYMMFLWTYFASNPTYPLLYKIPYIKLISKKFSKTPTYNKLNLTNNERNFKP